MKFLSSTASARAIAPWAWARSSAVGSAINRQCPPRTGVTRLGSTTPRPITSGSSTVPFTPLSGIAGQNRGRVAEGGARYLGNLVPLTIDGGGRDRSDHRGVRQGFLDGGVPLLAAGHGDEELLG